MTDRLVDFATSAVQRVQALVQSPSSSSAAGFTLESVLSGIQYMRVQHYTEQLALVGVLDWLLQTQLPQVRETNQTCWSSLC